MRKFLLLFSVLSIGLIMTSCLDNGDQNYTGTYQFSYVDMDDNGMVYARNEGGFITSNEIKTMLEPGKCYFISYTWSSEQGMSKTSDGYNVYNVILTDEPEAVPSTNLIMADAPSGSGNSMTLVFPPYFDAATYFGDFWTFSYQWKKKEGETALVRFYKATDNGSDNELDVLIDVRMTKMGTATGTTEKTENGVIAVNMSSLRSLLGPSTGTSTKNYQLKFRFYQEGKTEPTVSTQSYPMTVYSN